MTRALRSRGFLTILTLLLLTCGRVADIGTTLHFDPSLRREGNPVILLFRGGVGALVTSTVAVWILCTIGLIAFWRGPGLRVPRHPKNFRGFVRIWLRRVVQSRYPISQTLPGGSHWNEGLQAIRFAAVALSWGLIFGCVAAIHAWVATNNSTATLYQQMYLILRFGNVNYFVWLVTPLGFFAGAILFFLAEYNLECIEASQAGI